ncbi:RelA/SpoT family protein [Woodsholea maritima]|uniref:RelA/SpoT family protein n=1 Tax=Woodsholea maritima TaxID=240237 RepID=UPI000365DD72|nr:bifunctional (p)ppGpp synthetase/guanosine-3',5'-bis(diphosphate) 3'-pyrophosphohydrolase [Woodsholea maritima]
MTVANPDHDGPGIADAIPSADDLVARVRAYHKDADGDLIRRAYEFSKAQHEGQTRQSGDPYYGHTVAVAFLLADLRLDTATICAGLLHDTVEDTSATHEDLIELFGQDVADLVSGVTKLTQMELANKRTKQAENLQKLVVAITKDVRVLLVKLCDRLHNMRTLYHIDKFEKRERIARETLEIYAPLARKVGVNRICVELENLAFQNINPAAYVSITRRLSALRAQRSEAIAMVSEIIGQRLTEAGIDVRVFGREKRPYSIWRKLDRKGVSFEEIADIYAFRVITETVDECYRALGVIHQTWRCVPERFRDFISNRKPNNYASLHTTIIGPQNIRVELQIRTEQMEAIAETGVAAHWRYKSGTYSYDPNAAQAAGGDPLERLRPLVEILEQGGDPDEFLEHAKLEMLVDQVYCFTPKGDLIALPYGATPLDFAYAVHTELGNRTIGVKINSIERPLRTRIRNGDVIEIIKGGKRQPPPGWEDLVITGRARAAIRRLIRNSERDEFERIGKVIAEHAFLREGMEFREKAIQDAFKRLEVHAIEDLYLALGKGQITSTELIDAVFPGRREERGDLRLRELINDEKGALFVHGRGLTPGVTLHFADCCSPMPGDRIVGVLRPLKGVEVHVIDCERLASLEYEADQSNWIDLKWTAEAQSNSISIGRVVATLRNEPGVLARIAGTVGDGRGNIANVKTLHRTVDFFDMEFDLEVIDSRHLNNIIAALKTNDCVINVERARAD